MNAIWYWQDGVLYSEIGREVARPITLSAATEMATEMDDVVRIGVPS